MTAARHRHPRAHATRSAVRAACCRGRRRPTSRPTRPPRRASGSTLPLEAMPVERRRRRRRSGVVQPLGRLLADRPDARDRSRPACRADGLPSCKNPDESLAADSPIVAASTSTTGERAPFFAEVDQNTTRPQQARPDHPAARAPRSRARTTRSRSARRVKAADGSDARRSRRRSRRCATATSFAHPRFAAQGAHAGDLRRARARPASPRPTSCSRGTSCTASDEFLRRDLTTMRDAALPAIGDNGANLTFTATAQPNTPHDATSATSARSSRPTS